MSTSPEALAALAALPDDTTGGDIAKLLRQLTKEELVDALVYISGDPRPIRRAFSYLVWINAKMAESAAAHEAEAAGTSGGCGR